MNRFILTYLLILVCLLFIVNECYAWCPPVIRIWDWNKKTCVDQSVQIYAVLIPGYSGPIEQWDWEFYGALEGTFTGGSYSSTATAWSEFPGTYSVYAWGQCSWCHEWGYDWAIVRVVEVASVTSSSYSECVGCNVTFTVTTNPAGYGNLISWSGGGNPSTGSGSTFITNWSTAGTKTVTATCGTSSKSKQVTIVEVAYVSSDKNEACDGENVIFEVTTNPPGYGSIVSWSGGGTPSTGAGTTFTTKWSTGGTKTVTSTCGTSSKSKQVTILAGCDCTIPSSTWQYMSVGSVPDECDHTLTLTFNNNVYCYYYNGTKVGNCPYEGGFNTIFYWKTINDKRFYQTWFKSDDDLNDGSAGDEGTKYKYDSVLWTYDCIGSSLIKMPFEHPTIKGADDGTGGGAFEELSCP